MEHFVWPEKLSNKNIYELYVPTIRTERLSWIIEKLLKSEKSFMLLGDQNCGKTSILQKNLEKVSNLGNLDENEQKFIINVQFNRFVSSENF